MRDKNAYRSRIFSDSQLARILREYPEVKADAAQYCPTCKKNNGPRKNGTYQFEGETHDCDCEEQVELQLAYLNAGIGMPYQRLDWEDYHGDRNIVMKIAKYCDNPGYVDAGMGLLLIGDRGTGKTMLGTLTLKWFVRRGYRCLATTMANTVAEFTAGWRSNEEKRNFQDRFIGSQILLLDDVGRESTDAKSKLPEPIFESLLRTRVQRGRPTIVTSNLSVDKLESGYGAAALSLLIEQSVMFEFSAVDARYDVNKKRRKEIGDFEVRPIV